MFGLFCSFLNNLACAFLSYFSLDPAFYNFFLERQVNLLVSFIVKEKKKEVVMVIYKLHKGCAKNSNGEGKDLESYIFLQKPFSLTH